MARITKAQLQAENEKLRQDIYNLIRKKNEEAGIVTAMRYEMDYALEDSVWQSAAGDQKDASTYAGIMGHLKGMSSGR